MQGNIQQRIERFRRSAFPITLEIKDDNQADVRALNFHNQFQQHVMSCNLGLKPFMELGPDVEDYYKPS